MSGLLQQPEKPRANILGVVVKTKSAATVKISLLRETEKASGALRENGRVCAAASEVSPEGIHLFGTFKFAGAAMCGFRGWKCGAGVLLTSVFAVGW